MRKFDALVSKKLGQDQTLLINTLIAYISMWNMKYENINTSIVKYISKSW